MRYFIALFLIFTVNLTYAQQQANPILPEGTNKWWKISEIEDYEEVDLLNRNCPENKSPLEVAFDTYFSELLFSQDNSTARNRLYSYLFGVVMRSNYTMHDNLQSEYERYFDLFSHVVRLHATQALGTIMIMETLEVLGIAPQNGSLGLEDFLSIPNQRSYSMPDDQTARFREKKA